jgi:hypothetical protein
MTNAVARYQSIIQLQMAKIRALRTETKRLKAIPLILTTYAFDNEQQIIRQLERTMKANMAEIDALRAERSELTKRISRAVGYKDEIKEPKPMVRRDAELYQLFDENASLRRDKIELREELAAMKAQFETVSVERRALWDLVKKDEALLKAIVAGTNAETGKEDCPSDQ